MNEYFHRIRFFYDSKPKSVRYAGLGFAFMVFTVILVSLFDMVIVMIFATIIGLCGLVLFVMGLIYGGMDLYSSFKKPSAIK